MIIKLLEFNLNVIKILFFIYLIRIKYGDNKMNIIKVK